jgi:hypothetical protein
VAELFQNAFNVSFSSIVNVDVLVIIIMFLISNAKPVHSIQNDAITASNYNQANLNDEDKYSLRDHSIAPALKDHYQL